VLAKLDPSIALQILDQALAHGTTIEKQDAFATLGEMEYVPATGYVATWLGRLLAGGVAPEVTLDLLEAAGRKKADPVVAERLERFESSRAADDPLATWRECEQGGDPARGRQLCFERNDFQCVKCHRVGPEGAGEAGPDLLGIGARKERAYLLESIALPNRQIAVGFGNTVFVLNNGDLVDGRVIGETPTHWLAITTELGTVRIRKSAVVSTRQGLSAMPTDLVQRMSKRELRDLVAWLASVR
jgi:quinoprotein glucose dehydrogenase